MNREEKKKTKLSVSSPGPAPQGAFRGHAPPNDCLFPSKRGLCPEEINRLGAIGVQFVAKILVITREFVGKNCFFEDFAMNTDCLCGLTPGFMKIRVYFERRTFFIFSFCIHGLHLRIRGNSHVFRDEDQNLWKFEYCLERRPYILFGLHLRICGNSR